MSSATSRQGSRAEAARPLLSRTTIPILSGFLLGMAARNTVAPEMEFYVYAAGVCGLIAWLGLRYVAEARSRRDAALAGERATEKLKDHVTRHVARDPHFNPSG
jgi:hypothetical protein